MIHSMQTHDGDEVRAAMFLSCHPTALQQRDCDEYYQKKWVQERRKQYRQENDDEEDDEDNNENDDEDEEVAPQRTFVDAKPGYIRSSFLDNWETEADFMKEGGYFFHGPTADERRNWRDFRGKDVQMSDFERDFFLPGLDWQVEPFSVADAALILVRLCEASPDLSVEEERQNAVGIVAASSSSSWQKDIDSSDDENFDDVQEERASTANGISRVATKNLLSPGATPPTTSAINNNSEPQLQHQQQSSNEQNEQQGKRNKKTNKTKQTVDQKQKQQQKQEDSVSPLPPSSRASTAKMNNSPLQQLDDENNMGTMMMTMPPALTAITNNNKSTLFNSMLTSSAMTNNVVDIPPPSNMMNTNNNDDSNQSSSDEHSNSTKELNSPPKTKNTANNVHDQYYYTSTLPNYILFGPFVVYFSVYENIYDLAFSHFYRPLHDLGDDSPRFELEVARGKESVKKSSVLFVESRFEEEIIVPSTVMNVDSNTDDDAMMVINTNSNINNNSQTSQHVFSSSSRHYSPDQTVVLEAKRTFESTIATLEKEYQKTLVKRFGYFSPIQLASRLRQIRGPFLDPNTNAGIVLQPTSTAKK